MTVKFDTIRRLVERLAPAPICDTCIAGRLGMASSDEFRASLGELSVERGFSRERDQCSLCDEDGPVIRRQLRVF